MRLRVSASLPVEPVRASAVRILCAPVHLINRQARINRENLPLNTKVRDTRDTADPWGPRESERGAKGWGGIGGGV
jgi:hypothetical protein